MATEVDRPVSPLNPTSSNGNRLLAISSTNSLPTQVERYHIDEISKQEDASTKSAIAINDHTQTETNSSEAPSQSPDNVNLIMKSENETSVKTSDEATIDIKMGIQSDVKLEDSIVNEEQVLQPLEIESCENDPNFAIISSFFLSFAPTLGVTFSIQDLKSRLENSVNSVDEELIDLHIKLLRKRKMWCARDKWERAMVKVIAEYSLADSWELERYGYQRVKLSIKLELLKRLLEAQFDCNLKFKQAINSIEANSLRLLHVGRDAFGRTYWEQLDDEMSMRIYREAPTEELDWSIVCSNTTELNELIVELEGIDLENLKFETPPISDSDRDTDDENENELSAKLNDPSFNLQIVTDSQLLNGSLKSENDIMHEQTEASTPRGISDKQADTFDSKPTIPTDLTSFKRETLSDETREDLSTIQQVVDELLDAISRYHEPSAQANLSLIQNEQATFTETPEDVESKPTPTKREKRVTPKVAPARGRGSRMLAGLYEEGSLFFQGISMTGERRSTRIAAISEKKKKEEEDRLKKEQERLEAMAAKRKQIQEQHERSKLCMMTSSEDEDDMDDEDERHVSKSSRRNKSPAINKTGAKSTKAAKGKRRKQQTDSEDDEDELPTGRRTRKGTKSSRKTVQNGKSKKGNGKNKSKHVRWRPDDGSSENEDHDEELEEEDDQEDDYDELKFEDYDDEFAPEEMEPDLEPVVIRRARTAKRRKASSVCSESESDAESDEVVNDDTPCRRCGKYDHPEWILLCDKCDVGYHTSCLRPHILIIPEGDWYCPPCEHKSLIERLKEEYRIISTEVDIREKERQKEQLRKERLNYVTVNASNILPDDELAAAEKKLANEKKDSAKLRSGKRVSRAKKEKARHPKIHERSGDKDIFTSDDDVSCSDSRSGSDSESVSRDGSSESFLSSDEDEVDFLKPRRARQKKVSYQFKEYDELINSAILDEVAQDDGGCDRSGGGGGGGYIRNSGKDIRTIERANRTASTEEWNFSTDPSDAVEPNNGENNEKGRKQIHPDTSGKKIELAAAEGESTTKKDDDENTQDPEDLETEKDIGVEDDDEEEEDEEDDDRPVNKRKPRRRLNDLSDPSDPDATSDEEFVASEVDDEDEDTELEGGVSEAQSDATEEFNSEISDDSLCRRGRRRAVKNARVGRTRASARREARKAKRHSRSGSRRQRDDSDEDFGRRKHSKSGASKPRPKRKRVSYKELSETDLSEEEWSDHQPKTKKKALRNDSDATDSGSDWSAEALDEGPRRGGTRTSTKKRHDDFEYFDDDKDDEDEPEANEDSTDASGSESDNKTSIRKRPTGVKEAAKKKTTSPKKIKRKAANSSTPKKKRKSNMIPSPVPGPPPEPRHPRQSKAKIANLRDIDSADDDEEEEHEKDSEVLSTKIIPALSTEVTKPMDKNDLNTKDEKLKDTSTSHTTPTNPHRSEIQHPVSLDPMLSSEQFPRPPQPRHQHPSLHPPPFTTHSHAHLGSQFPPHPHHLAPRMIHPDQVHSMHHQHMHMGFHPGHVPSPYGHFPGPHHLPPHHPHVTQPPPPPLSRPVQDLASMTPESIQAMKKPRKGKKNVMEQLAANQNSSDGSTDPPKGSLPVAHHPSLMPPHLTRPGHHINSVPPHAIPPHIFSPSPQSSVYSDHLRIHQNSNAMGANRGPDPLMAAAMFEHSSHPRSTAPQAHKTEPKPKKSSKKNKEKSTPHEHQHVPTLSKGSLEVNDANPLAKLSALEAQLAKTQAEMDPRAPVDSKSPNSRKSALSTSSCTPSHDVRGHLPPESPYGPRHPFMDLTRFPPFGPGPGSSMPGRGGPPAPPPPPLHAAGMTSFRPPPPSHIPHERAPRYPPHSHHSNAPPGSDPYFMPPGYFPPGHPYNSHPVRGAPPPAHPYGQYPPPPPPPPVTGYSSHSAPPPSGYHGGSSGSPSRFMIHSLLNRATGHEELRSPASTGPETDPADLPPSSTGEATTLTQL